MEVMVDMLPVVMPSVAMPRGVSGPLPLLLPRVETHNPDMQEALMVVLL